MNYQLFVVSEGSPKTVVELMDGHGDHQLGAGGVFSPAYDNIS